MNFLHAYTCQHCQTTGMRNNIFDGRSFVEHQLKICGQLVKMLITLDSRDIIGSNLVFLCILTLSSHWYAKRWRGFTEHHFGWSSSFGENAHSLKPHGILGSNFVYLCILTLSSHWYEKR